MTVCQSNWIRRETLYLWGIDTESLRSWALKTYCTFTALKAFKLWRQKIPQSNKVLLLSNLGIWWKNRLELRGPLQLNYFVLSWWSSLWGCWGCCCCCWRMSSHSLMESLECNFLLITLCTEKVSRRKKLPSQKSKELLSALLLFSKILPSFITKLLWEDN